MPPSLPIRPVNHRTAVEKNANAHEVYFHLHVGHILDTINFQGCLKHLFIYVFSSPFQLDSHL